jgi:adenylylsulfate kinase
VLWLTGLPSAEKSTISKIIHDKLKANGIRVELLDGDHVRRNLSPDLGFSKADREMHAMRGGTYVSKLLARNEVIAIVALISPYRSFRGAARNLIGDFVEVFVNAPD